MFIVYLDSEGIASPLPAEFNGVKSLLLFTTQSQCELFSANRSGTSCGELDGKQFVSLLENHMHIRVTHVLIDLMNHMKLDDYLSEYRESHQD